MQNKHSLKLKKPELLAPAGSMDGFMAVLRAGADAVYMAGSKFGARAYAANFSDEEFLFCIKYAHLYGRKIYLTINTLIRNDELQDLIAFVKPLYEQGLDAVIVQDLGVISAIYQNFPGLEIHASTQLSICTSEGTDFLKKYGITRVVPARELSLEEIKRLKEESGLELECFIHGAICYCYSGNCLFSSVLGARSGNRGKCAQPCRLPYSCQNNKDIYPLSLKDMCTIDIIGELIDSGIDSFKIEGRMKKPEYAAGVTSIYRKAIDNYIASGNINLSANELKTLRNLYIRGEVSDGYYHRYNGPSMITLNSPAYQKNDDKLLETINSDFVKAGCRRELTRLGINFYASFITGEPAEITAICNDITVSVTGTVVEIAKNEPINAENIEKQLKKLGNTVFNYNENSLITVSDDAYYNIKGINELRREIVLRLEKEIIKANGFAVLESAQASDLANTSEYYTDNIRRAESNFDEPCDQTAKYAISVLSSEQLETIKNNKYYFGADLYIPEELLFSLKDSFIHALSLNYKIFICGAYIRRYRNFDFYEKIEPFIEKYPGILNGFVIRNPEDISYALKLKSFCSGLRITSDYGIYAWNGSAIEVISAVADIIGLPTELSDTAVCHLAKDNRNLHFERQLYGRIPLMQTANCVRKTLEKCNPASGSKWISLTDRTGRKLPVYTDCEHCRNTVYNSVPTTVFKNLNKFESNIRFRIDFTDEDSVMTQKVLDFYNDPVSVPDWEYTTAFSKKSTE